MKHYTIQVRPDYSYRPSNWEEPSARRPMDEPLEEPSAVDEEEAKWNQDIDDHVLSTWDLVEDTLGCDTADTVNGEGTLTIGAALLTVLDWMAAHSVTDRAAQDMNNILRMVHGGSESNLPTFAQVKKIISLHKNSTVTKVPACRHGCVAFYDLDIAHLAGTKYSELETCPKCTASRYVTCPNKGSVESHYCYVFNIAAYVRDLFAKPDLVPYLFNDLLGASGSLRRSRGYKAKVHDCPILNTDRRNQAFILSTDGMPFFKDMNAAGAWPCVLRDAMLPDGLWDNPAYAYLAAIEPQSHLEADPVSGRLISVRR